MKISEGFSTADIWGQSTLHGVEKSAKAKASKQEHTTGRGWPRAKRVGENAREVPHVRCGALKVIAKTLAFSQCSRHRL